MEFTWADGTIDPLPLGVPKSWEIFEKMPKVLVFGCQSCWTEVFISTIGNMQYARGNRQWAKGIGNLQYMYEHMCKYKIAIFIYMRSKSGQSPPNQQPHNLHILEIFLSTVACCHNNVAVEPPV